jgi:hypothetical protein
MQANWLRHPFQTIRTVRATLIDRAIIANLKQAREYAANGNHEGFERHCGHAERLAERHAPGRVDDVERVAAAGPAFVSATSREPCSGSETAPSTPSLDR